MQSIYFKRITFLLRVIHDTVNQSSGFQLIIGYYEINASYLIRYSKGFTTLASTKFKQRTKRLLKTIEAKCYPLLSKVKNFDGIFSNSIGIIAQKEVAKNNDISTI
jgi:hypothetical protein